MSQLQTVQMALLRADPNNPRLELGAVGQNEVLRAFAEMQGPQMAALAGDIAQFGLSPGEPFYVTEIENGKAYIVLDGNRRLTALRALESPELFKGAIGENVLKSIRKHSADYQAKGAIDEVLAVVFLDEEEARHWIDLKHGNQAGGAGFVKWGSDEIARFKARVGEKGIETQALDFLQRRNQLSPTDRRRVRPASLRRLLGTPKFRERIGFGLKDKRLRLLADEDKVADALLWTVGQLATGAIKTPDIIGLDGRLKIANQVPVNLAVTPTIALDKATDVNDAGTPQKKAKKPKEAIPPKPRPSLVPKECILNIPANSRERDIEWELRRLQIDDYGNSVGVMFRVFIELSCDAYLDKNPVAKEGDALSHKMKRIAADLYGNTKLNQKQVEAVNKMCEPDSMLATTVKTMNSYVHNKYIYPSGTDLRNGWSTIEPFLTAIWGS